MRRPFGGDLRPHEKTVMRASNSNNPSPRAQMGGIDIGLIFAGLVLLDLAPFIPFDLFATNPNPLWIPVVLAAVRYGRLAGLVVAGAATILDMVMGWSPLLAHADLYAYLAVNLAEPVLWIFAVLVLGGIRERQNERLHTALVAREEREAEARSLAEHCRELSREVGQLEHRVATSAAAAAESVLFVLEQLRLSGPERAWDKFSQTISRLIGADGIEIYLLDVDGWMMFEPGALHGAHIQRPADEATARICRNVAAANRVISCADENDAELLQNRAAMAAPLTGPGGRLLGVVVLREVDAQCLTDAGEAALALCASLLTGNAIEAAATTLPAAAEAMMIENAPKLRAVPKVG